MKVDHGKALALELLVRKAFNLKDRGQLGGLIDAAHFERAPLDAALFSFARLYDPSEEEKFSSFINKYYDLSFKEGVVSNEVFDSYFKELDILIKYLKEFFNPSYKNQL